jgi:glycosyltransferase involved in cell wall biosynthesis
VVAYPIDGTPEVVLPDKTGLLVKAFDAGALANGIVELAGSPNRRQNMGRYGRTLCLNRFDHQAMVDKLERLYQKVLREGIKGSRD